MCGVGLGKGHLSARKREKRGEGQCVAALRERSHGRTVAALRAMRVGEEGRNTLRGSTRRETTSSDLSLEPGWAHHAGQVGETQQQVLSERVRERGREREREGERE